MSDDTNFEYDSILTVVRGKHKGVTGVFDNEGDRGDSLIIYPGVWMADDFIDVPRRFCRRATEEEERAYREKYQNDVAVHGAFARMKKDLDKP